MTLWRNGSASDSRSEGCVFKSRQGQTFFLDLSVVRGEQASMIWAQNSGLVKMICIVNSDFIIGTASAVHILKLERYRED